MVLFQTFPCLHSQKFPPLPFLYLNTCNSPINLWHHSFLAEGKQYAKRNSNSLNGQDILIYQVLHTKLFHKEWSYEQSIHHRSQINFSLHSGDQRKRYQAASLITKEWIFKMLQLLLKSINIGGLDLIDGFGYKFKWFWFEWFLLMMCSMSKSQQLELLKN